MTLSGSRKPEAEETLENSFNWVPKVQGRDGRISQAKGERSEGRFRHAPFAPALNQMFLPELLIFVSATSLFF